MGDLWERICGIVRAARALQVPLYAANACFFLVLAVFPALLLLLGLLVRVPQVGLWLAQLPEALFPEVLRETLQALTGSVYANSGGSALGISAVTVIWSASRGLYGITAGLNAVYGRKAGRFRSRLVSVGHTLLFLAAVPLLLAGTHFGPVWILPAMFAALFMILPRGGNGFRESLPGAVLASIGWLIFSKGYSLYVRYFGRLRSVYGSVYAIALGMLWLYGLMCIFLYGGALNAALQKKNVSEP